MASPQAAQSRHEARIPVVTPAGELDMATAPRLRDVLTGITDAGARTVLVDLNGVTFADSSGLAPLLDRDGEVEIVVTGVSKPVLRLVRLLRTIGQTPEWYTPALRPTGRKQQ